MTLLQLKYIVKIVECGSMNEASHALYVSQPALSSSVKELENELGIEIFTRSSQGIALTVDGAEFLTYARQVPHHVHPYILLWNVLRYLHTTRLDGSLPESGMCYPQLTERHVHERPLQTFQYQELSVPDLR